MSWSLDWEWLGWRRAVTRLGTSRSWGHRHSGTGEGKRRHTVWPKWSRGRRELERKDAFSVALPAKRVKKCLKNYLAMQWSSFIERNEWTHRSKWWAVTNSNKSCCKLEISWFRTDRQWNICWILCMEHSVWKATSLERHETLPFNILGIVQALDLAENLFPSLWFEPGRLQLKLPLKWPRPRPLEPPCFFLFKPSFRAMRGVPLRWFGCILSA